MSSHCVETVYVIGNVLPIIAKIFTLVVACSVDCRRTVIFGLKQVVNFMSSSADIVMINLVYKAESVCVSAPSFLCFCVFLCMATFFSGYCLNLAYGILTPQRCSWAWGRFSSSFLPMRCYAGMGISCFRMSVCLSHASIVSKWLHGSSWFFA